MATTATDRAFARANLYRFLSLAFAYPTQDLHRELVAASEAAVAASACLSASLEAPVQAVAERLSTLDRPALASSYRKIFTFSASPDCPLNESAYSAKHIYQEVEDLADIAGFYTAFGLEIAGERPDELAAELEFCALLSLKEGLRAKALTTRTGQRLPRRPAALLARPPRPVGRKHRPANRGPGPGDGVCRLRTPAGGICHCGDRSPEDRADLPVPGSPQ